MTGSGSATVAFAKEQSFQGSLVDSDTDGTPEYYLPGKNITVDEISISNALERLRLPDQAESVESIAGNFEGALSASWAMSADRIADVHDIVFNNSGTSFTNGQAATSAWFLGVDYLSGTAERAVTGLAPTEYSVEYSSEENTVTESITAVYADETLNTSITPSNISEPATGKTVPFHGASLDINSVAQTKLQSFTLTISNIARPQQGASRYPLDMVIDAPESTLDVEAIFSESDQLELAYGGGGSSVTEPQNSVGGVSATIDLSVNGSTARTFNLSEVTPNDYDWSQLVSNEDTTEPITCQVNGVSVA